MPGLRGGTAQAAEPSHLLGVSAPQPDAEAEAGAQAGRLQVSEGSLTLMGAWGPLTLMSPH